MSIRCREADTHIMCNLDFGDFAEDFVGHNLDDYEESWLQCDLEGDFLFSRCQGRCVDT
jgi:hypothetical protein